MTGAPKALGLAFIIAMTTPHVAAADDAAAARFHDERAREHYQAGRYEAAIREFFLEQRIAPNPRIVFNIALCFKLLDRKAEALQMFTEYLASDDEDEERRTQAREAVEELAPEVARLYVTSEPPGAEIFVDHEEHGSYGRTPRTVAVPSGEHRILLRKDGHRQSESTVAAERGLETRVEMTLSAITGTLSVSASTDARAVVRTPGGSVVLRGETPVETTLPPGPYEVAVTAEGFETRRGLVEVHAERTTRYEASLEALPPPSGTLTITSNHAGALVSVDGEPAGFTPLVLEDVFVGARSLHVGREGLDPWSGEVEIDTETPAWLTVTLQDEDAGRVHSPATWILGGTGAASLVAGGAVGIAALVNRKQFDDAVADVDRRDEVPQIRQRGETLNAVADTLFIVGGATLITAMVLFILEELREPAQSSGTVSRDVGEEAE